MVYVEGLARLRELPVRGAIFAFFPLLLRGGSGAPGRAVAFVEEG
jgi:kynurenine formamidase